MKKGAKNIGRLNPQDSFAGHMGKSIEDVETGDWIETSTPVYQEEAILPSPESQAKLAKACFTCIARGNHVEVINDFYLAGCVFPEADPDSENNLIRFRVECGGPTRLHKNICRIAIGQYDRNGNLITHFQPNYEN